MIPRLFKDMPPKKGGRWVAVVIHRSRFCPRREVRQCTVTGLRRAYLVARLMAFWDDVVTPWLDGELAIEWAVYPEFVLLKRPGEETPTSTPT